MNLLGNGSIIKHMTVVITGPSEKEAKAQIKAIRKTSARATKSKATARAYLLKHGYITKDGKLTKQYGG